MPESQKVDFGPIGILGVRYVNSYRSTQYSTGYLNIRNAVVEGSDVIVGEPEEGQSRTRPRCYANLTCLSTKQNTRWAFSHTTNLLCGWQMSESQAAKVTNETIARMIIHDQTTSLNDGGKKSRTEHSIRRTLTEIATNSLQFTTLTVYLSGGENRSSPRSGAASTRLPPPPLPLRSLHSLSDAQFDFCDRS